MKVCSVCGVEESEEVPFQKVGLKCKCCKAEYDKEHRFKNRDRIKASRRKHYSENKEVYKKRDADYRSRNKEKVTERGKRYYSANKESISEMNKLYHAKNRERILVRMKEYREANPEIVKAGKDKCWHDSRANMDGTSFRNYMLKRAAGRAKKRGIEFSITIDDIIVGTHCPISGIRFDCTTEKRFKANPNTPSLDRIDNSKGYIKGNVWVISSRFNTIKGNATVAELRLIADKVEEKLLTKPQ